VGEASHDDEFDHNGEFAMASNWPTQCLVLLKRSWRESTRDLAKLGGGVGGAILISGITCALFSEMGRCVSFSGFGWHVHHINTRSMNEAMGTMRAHSFHH
jgi:hypothetical protein